MIDLCFSTFWSPTYWALKNVSTLFVAESIVYSEEDLSYSGSKA